jgi:hypothetical protein
MENLPIGMEKRGDPEKSCLTNMKPIIRGGENLRQSPPFDGTR